MIKILSISAFLLCLIFLFTSFKNKKKIIWEDIFNVNIIFLFILLTSSFLNIKFFYLTILLFFLRFLSLAYLKKKDPFLQLIKKQKNLTIIFLLFIILAIDIYFNTPLSWDAQNYNYPKTISFFYNLGFDNLKNLGAQHYPHLGPYAWAFFWNLSFESTEIYGRFYFLFLFLLTILLFVEILNLKNHNNNSILFLLFVILLYNQSYFSGDLEIFSFSLFSLLSYKIYKYFNSNVNQNNIYTYLIIILLCWIKNENLVLLLIYFLVMFFNKKKYDLFFLKCLLLVFLSFFLRYFVFKHYNFVSEDYDFENTVHFSFTNFIEGIFLISYYLFTAYLKNLSSFLILLSIVLMLLFSLKNKISDFEKKNIICYFFVVLSFYPMFMLNLTDVAWQSRVSLSKILFEFSGIFLINIFLFLRKFNFFKN